MQKKIASKSIPQIENDTYQRIRGIDKKINNLKKQDAEYKSDHKTTQELKEANKVLQYVVGEQKAIIDKLINIIGSIGDNDISLPIQLCINIISFFTGLVSKEQVQNTDYGILLIIVLLLANAILVTKPKKRFEKVKNFIYNKLKRIRFVR
jgi:hypothetical protein